MLVRTGAKYLWSPGSGEKEKIISVEERQQRKTNE
jgi:hypothetical protein